jgi:hypothetical protein
MRIRPDQSSGCPLGRRAAVAAEGGRHDVGASRLGWVRRRNCRRRESEDWRGRGGDGWTRPGRWRGAASFRRRWRADSGGRDGTVRGRRYVRGFYFF